jgi:hypothetical protein
MQRPDVDYDETFNPVVKSVMVCTVMSLALSLDWLIHQLHSTWTETVYTAYWFLRPYST